MDVPYDCWKLILNFLREDLADECKYSSFYYYYPLDPLDIYLLILRSTSRNIQTSIKKYQLENASIIGFSKGAVTYYLSQKGYLSCLKYFATYLRYELGQRAADEAAERGHYECLKFIGEVNPKISWAYDSAQKAARSGNYECLVYCHQRGANLSLADLENAAASGNLEMVKYIRPYVNTKYANLYTNKAASSGHLHILQYAVESGDGLAESVCQKAAEENHYECLVYAHQNGGIITEKCIREALRFGSVKCAIYLLEQMRMEPNSEPVFADTAYHCVTIELLKLLHKRGASWGYFTCATAIAGGSVECLRFVLETGAPKTDLSLYVQASGTKDWFEYFKILEEYNIPHSQGEYMDCSYAGNLEYMKYIRETVKLPWTSDLANYLVLHKNFKCLEYAHEHGCPWHELTCISAVDRMDADLKFLKYAHEHGAPWDERVTFAAASRGRLDMLKYAHENGCEWNQKIIREADFRGHKKCVEYMQSEGLKLVNTYKWDK